MKKRGNKTARSRTALRMPRLENIPDLGVSPEAAKLIRVALWLEQAKGELDRFLEGISLKGAGCEYYHNDFDSLGFDFWIAALTNIAGPDKRAKTYLKPDDDAGTPEAPAEKGPVTP